MKQRATERDRERESGYRLLSPSLGNFETNHFQLDLRFTGTKISASIHHQNLRGDLGCGYGGLVPFNPLDSWLDFYLV
ncbi:hypothetical protein H5410_012932 [Solanum commersonii]|uniref:Uncharacterized protein n=1 Tax=Solanum commersonii TaxID=4109 RepID=A0A9J6AU18_SOLCO|nr:hypothetical protein H5410_012932 [Solanum commersonii]